MVANKALETITCDTEIIETPIQIVSEQLTKVKDLQKTIKQLLVPEIDYGTIKGCGDKPTLFKAGAEKIIVAFGLQTYYEIVEKIEKFENKGFCHYLVKSTITHNDNFITNGFGSANSNETKWKYKWVYANELPKSTDLTKFVTKNGKYKVEDVAFDKFNTILKMAKKRSQVDAVLTIAGLSEIFTQDFDDMSDAKYVNGYDNAVETVKKQQPKQATKTKHICSVCETSVSDRIYQFSTEKYGKCLCMNCQNKQKT